MSITFRQISTSRINRPKTAVARVLSAYEAFDGERKVGRVYSVEDSSRTGCLWVGERGFDTRVTGATRADAAANLAAWVAKNTVAR